MLEAECAFVDNVEELCDIVEDYVRSVATHMLSLRSEIETASTFFDRKRQVSPLAGRLITSLFSLFHKPILRNRL